jgi:hypothetical protein
MPGWSPTSTPSWSSPPETTAGSPACGVTGEKPAATRPPGPYILGVHTPDGGILPQERGLCIVVRACDELEAQVSRLHGLRWREGELADLS